jgi:hypothetical protein
MNNKAFDHIPPIELRQQWRAEAPTCRDSGVSREDFLMNKAAQWAQRRTVEAGREWLKEARNHGFGYAAGRVMASNFLAGMTPLDKSDAADAARLRWMLSGNGYFLEEEGLCGHSSDEETDRGRRAIDRRMEEERDDV